MDSNQWDDIQRVYFAALDRPESDRAAFVNAECAGNLAMAHDVLSLLDEVGDERALSIEGSLLVETGSVEGADRSGESIDGYRLVERIGYGGMGEVYRAERTDGEFEQAVALKLLRRERQSTDSEQRFRTERHILARLDHPSIVPILDGGVDRQGQPWFIMPLVEGTSITHYCDRQSLDLRGRIGLFLRVCDAVQYAHRNLVVHRDLKPSNILVTGEGLPRLLDFGIAKLLDQSATTHPVVETRTGQWVMTPDYAAPEQVLEQHPTTAVDVYALGILLYELLSGKNPQSSDGHSRTEQLRAVVEVEPPLPSRVAVDPRRRGEIRGDLDTIVSMAIRKEPERRYATVADLAEDLQRWLDLLPVRARPDTLRYRTSRFVRRNRTAVVISATLLAGLVALAALAGYQANLASDQARVAKEERDQAELERDRARHVVALLADLFRSTDPTNFPGGDTLRVGDFIDRSAEAVLAGLGEQPLIQAEMMHVLGTVRRHRSEFLDARSLLQSAYDTQLAERGWEADRTYDSSMTSPCCIETSRTTARRTCCANPCAAGRTATARTRPRPRRRTSILRPRRPISMKRWNWPALACAFDERKAPSIPWSWRKRSTR